MLWNWIKPILFRFDAERVHDWTHAILKTLGQYPIGKKLLSLMAGRQVPVRSHSVLGMTFSSRLGLAAGFDKNAELLGALPHLGFGFCEIGTVTPRPQAGNSKPRLFREPSRQALFNAMGFNGLGAEVVARNLRDSRLRGDLPIHFRVGVNLGKNKQTSASEAHLDYAKAAESFEGLADYLVINVSSPNTPGLRDLQTEEAIQRIVRSVREVIQKWKFQPPILLKLAPEVVGEEFRAILTQGEDWGISGWVLTNTLAGERKISGGWSGSPLTQVSLDRLRAAKTISRLPVISVGGVMNTQDALDRMKAGADLIQIYTGWIYGGVRFPGMISRAI